jgi:hypothetical protein
MSGPEGNDWLTFRALLELIYPLPRELDTREAHERYGHRDLPRRARVEVARERERLRLRLMLDDDPDAWALERLRKLNEVLDRGR